MKAGLKQPKHLEESNTLPKGEKIIFKSIMVYMIYTKIWYIFQLQNNPFYTFLFFKKYF